MRWTWPRTTAAVVAGLLLGSASVLLADGDLRDDLIAVGAVAVFVAVTGRISTVRRARWAKVTFTPQTGTIAATRQRGVVHHRDPFSMAFLPLLAAGVAAGIWINRSAPVPTLLIITGLFAPWLVGLYLFGLSLKVTVTAARVVVHKRFTRYDIPRHLVTGLTTRSDGDLTLTITGHPPVIVTAGAFWGGKYAHHRPPQIRTARRLDRLLHAVPAGPDTAATVTTRPRTTARVLAAVAAGCFLAAMIAAMTGRLEP